MSMIFALVLSISVPAQADTTIVVPPAKRPPVVAAETIAPKRLPTGEPKRSCLTPSETREAVAGRKLFAPYLALRAAATRARGETIGVRLCHLNEELVYDITVLRRDGRVVKVIVEAATGHILRTVNDR